MFRFMYANVADERRGNYRAKRRSFLRPCPSVLFGFAFLPVGEPDDVFADRPEVRVASGSHLNVTERDASRPFALPHLDNDAIINVVILNPQYLHRVSQAEGLTRCDIGEESVVVILFPPYLERERELCIQPALPVALFPLIVFPVPKLVVALVPRRVVICTHKSVPYLVDCRTPVPNRSYTDPPKILEPAISSVKVAFG